jgi:hypothetical protein
MQQQHQLLGQGLIVKLQATGMSTWQFSAPTANTKADLSTPIGMAAELSAELGGVLVYVQEWWPPCHELGDNPSCSPHHS